MLTGAILPQPEVAIIQLASENGAILGKKSGVERGDFSHQLIKLINSAIPVRDKAHMIASGNNQHALFGKVLAKRDTGTFGKINKDHVGLNSCWIDTKPGNVGKTPSEAKRVFMILGKTINIVLEGKEPRRRQYPRLTHAAANKLADAMRPFDH